MSQICVTHNHSLGSNRIRDEAEKLAKKLVDRYGGRCFWRTGRVDYSNSGIEAVIRYDATRLKVDLKMGLMMTAFKEVIEAEIKRYLNKNIS